MVSPKAGQRNDFGIAMRFNDIKEIGSGGMGRVFSAYSPELTCKVILKTLQPQLSDHPSYQLRLKQEAEILSRLSHPSMISCYGMGTLTQNGTEFPCLIMEYIDGETLQERLNRSGSIGYKEVVPYFLGLADGIQYLHQNKIVHLDIKPENILLARDGRILLTDFGIAATEDSIDTTAPLREPYGSLAYTAPERLRGELSDGRSDLYSFGMVLYAMSHGKGFFEGREKMSIWAELVYEPESLRLGFDKEIPLPFQNLIRKLVEKKREARYSDIPALLVDFHQTDLRNSQGGPSKRRSIERAAIFSVGLVFVSFLFGWSAWERAEPLGKVQSNESENHDHIPASRLNDPTEPIIQLGSVTQGSNEGKRESESAAKLRESADFENSLPDAKLEQFLIGFKSMIENRRLDVLKNEFSPDQEVVTRFHKLFGSESRLEAHILQVSQEGSSIKVNYRISPSSSEAGEEGLLLFSGHSWKLL
jgi:serine/threonine protein kinase